MRAVTTNVYQFDELSDKAKQVAINDNSDINVYYDWWQQPYEDAREIGLKITGFGLDRDKHANGEFLLSANEVAQNIFNNHGETCETYKTAEAFMEKWQPIFDNYMQTEEGEDELLEIEDEFLNDLLSDYANMLQEDLEYLQTDEAIAETLIANEYEFIGNGNRFKY